MTRARSFLLVTWAGGGNVPPLTVLAGTLAGQGHRVRVLGPRGMAARFSGAGIAFQAHRSADEWTDGHPIDWSGPPPTEAQRMAYLRGMAEDVLAECDREPADALVVDYMQSDALAAAEATSLPFAAFVHTLYARVAAADRSPMAAFADLDRINSLRETLGVAPLSRVTRALDRAARVLVATVPALDRPLVPLPANVRYVGPLIEPPGPDHAWAPPEPADLPLVVVSLSTTPMGEVPVLQRIVDALADEPLRVLVTVGDHVPAAALRPAPNSVVSGYVRHSAVLPHAKLVVSHAGLGTVSAALSFGLPMVCVPLGREQPANAEAVEAVGAGRWLHRDAGLEELREVVRDVVSGEQYRRAAGSAADEMASYGNGTLAAAELADL